MRLAFKSFIAFTYDSAILVQEFIPMSRKLSIKVIVVAGILGFVAVSTWSDYYYSKLERDYAVLKDFHNIGGFVTDLRVHWNYSYLTIDSIERILIYPTRNEHHETQEFSELVEVGDLIHKGEKSDEIYLQKGDVVYKFRNNEPHR
jgi:hypothetical protein